MLGAPRMPNISHSQKASYLWDLLCQNSMFVYIFISHLDSTLTQPVTFKMVANYKKHIELFFEADVIVNLDALET